MLFILLFILAGINMSYALSYEQCIGHIVNTTYINLYADTNIFGGRYDNCDITCDQRLYYKYYCYSDLGSHYDVWWAILLLFAIGLFTYSVYSLYHMIKAESDSKPKINPQYINVYATIVISIIKFIWMICTFNGKDPNSIIGGKYMDFFAIKFSQCIIFSELFLLILVWKTIVNTTQNMKKIDNVITRKNYIYTTLFICGLMLCVFPLAMIGVDMPILYTISNVVLCVYLLILVIGSFIYSCQLNKILNSGIDDGKRKSAIQNIKIVNYGLCMAGILIFILFGLDTVNIFKNPIIRLWVYWFNLNLIEFVMYILIIYSVSYKAKIANGSHKRLGSVFTNNKTVAINSAISNSINASTFDKQTI